MNMHTDLPAAPLPGLPLDTRLRPALHSGGHLQGLFCGLTLPALVEMAAFARFDFVVIDNEHGLAGFETTEHMLRAARASGIMPIVRCFAVFAHKAAEFMLSHRTACQPKTRYKFNL